MIMIDRNELHAMKTAARFDEFGNTRFPTMAKRAVEFGLEPADSIELLPNHRPPDYPC